MTREHYLVPFGREPGGLLEFLSLPATATEMEIGNRRAVVQKQIQRDAKKKQAFLREEFENGRITKAEHDERQAQIDEEKTASLIRLIDLYNAYKAQMSQQRDATRQKRKLVAAGWADLAGAELSEESLLARRPLPRIDDDALTQLTAEPPPPRSVRDVGRWCTWRDLAPLIEADRLWESLPSATRNDWDHRVAKWRAEIEEAAPRLAAAGAAMPREPEFPHLAGARSRAIKQLAATEVPNDARPNRRADAAPLTMDALMNLLARAFEAGADGLPHDVPPDVRDLLARLTGNEPPL